MRAITQRQSPPPTIRVPAIRGDQANALTRHSATQQTVVRSFVVQQTRGARQANLRMIDQRFDQLHLVRRGAGDIDTNRRLFAIGEQHHLRAFACLRVAYAAAPFFAGTNVPSPGDLEQTLFGPQGEPLVQTLLDGKHDGESFHRQPATSKACHRAVSKEEGKSR